MISFTVYGVPVAQGSMVAFMPKNAKQPLMHSANGAELKKWRKEIAKAAAITLRGESPAGREVALKVSAKFVFKAPAKSKYADCVKAPDLDKLLRALLDGMTGVVYEDDAQVVEFGDCKKEYGSEPRLEVSVEDVGVVPVLIKRAPIKDADLPF